MAFVLRIRATDSRGNNRATRQIVGGRGGDLQPQDRDFWRDRKSRRKARVYVVASKVEQSFDGIASRRGTQQRSRPSANRTGALRAADGRERRTPHAVARQRLRTRNPP